MTDKEQALVKAARAAALMEAVDAMNNSHRYCSPVGTIQSLITQSDKDALRELMMKVADAVNHSFNENIEDVVDRVLEGK